MQIFENKESVKGCSNLHPQVQIWAQSSLPTQIEKTQNSLKNYFDKNGSNLLLDYLAKELEAKERIVIENEHFVASVPFWVIWPFETLIFCKRKVTKIIDFNAHEVAAYAIILNS